MINEKNIQQDNLEGIISERLGERQRKVAQMNAWDNKDKANRIKTLSLAAAACVTIAIVAVPFIAPALSPMEELGIEYSTTEYRAASPELAEIERLITNQQYEAALYATESMIEEMKTYVAQLDIMAGNDDTDELDYEIEAGKSTICELRWTHIWLLAKMKQYKDAKKELRTYMKDKAHCEHREEAERLLAALKEKDENFVHRWVTFYKSLLK